MVIDTLREQWARIGKMDEEIATIERRINLWFKEDEACGRIAEIPGVGPLTATAAVAIMGDAKAFKSGREFAAFAGLVPRQTGTGGRIRLPTRWRARSGHYSPMSGRTRRNLCASPRRAEA